MKVEDKFHIRGRGNVFTMTNDREVMHKGAFVRRLRDGATWPIRGVERFCKDLVLEKLRVGEGIGLLVGDDCELAIGDEVEIVESVPACPFCCVSAGEPCAPFCDDGLDRDYGELPVADEDKQ